MPQDVFDAAFWQGPYADRLRDEVRPFRGQTNVLGYFLDNEPAWNAPHIFAFYLRLGKHTPGSRAFLAYLQTYYRGRISLLNQEWGSSYARFAQIPGTRPPPRSLRRMQRGIVQAWRTKVVATYYQRYAAWLAHPRPPPCLLPSAHELPLERPPIIGVGESPVPSSRFVRQPVDTVLHEALDPLVDKASADADRGSNVGDRHTIGQLQNDATPSGAPSGQSGRPLPRQQRLPVCRCEADV
jgi:hypothetical protein